MLQLNLLFVSGAEKNETLSFSVLEGDNAAVDKVLYYALGELGYNVNITGLGMMNAIFVANSGQYDGLSCQIEGLNEDFPDLIPAEEALQNIYFRAYTKIGSGVSAEKWDDLINYRVGHLYQLYHISKMMPEGTEVINFHNTARLLAAVEAGEIDVAVIPLEQYATLNVPNNVENSSVLDVKSLYTFFYKAHADIVPLYTEQLRKMKQEGILQRILMGGELPSANNTENLYLYVSSNNEDIGSTLTVGNEIKKVLSENVTNRLVSIALSFGKESNNHNKMTNTINFLRSQFIAGNPDAIIVSGNSALEFIKTYYYNFFKGTPVVFCDIDNFENVSLQGFESYFTGVNGTFSAAETVDGIIELFPNTKSLFVINDYSLDGIAIKNDIKSQLTDYENKLNIVYNDDVTLPRLLDQLSKLPHDSAVLCGMYLTDLNDETYSENLVQQLFHKYTHVPIFGLRSSNIGFGQIGGKYKQMSFLGKTAAETAALLISGEHVSSLPIVTVDEESNEWIFDYNILLEHNLYGNDYINSLKPRVINEPPTIKNSNPFAYKILLFSAIISSIMVVLLIGLVITISSKNRQLVESKKSLHTAEEMLEKELQLSSAKKQTEEIVDTAPLMCVRLTGDIVTNCNKYSVDTLGIKSGDDFADYLSQPEHYNTIINKFDDTGFVFGETVEFLTVSGETNRFLINMSKFEIDGMTDRLIWGMNIEESERQRDLIDRAQHDLEKLIEVLPTPLLIIEPVHCYILYGNNKSASLYGFNNPSELMGQDIFQFMPDKQENGESTVSFFTNFADEILLSQASLTCEMEHMRPDGTIIITKTIGTSFIYSNINAVVVLIQDISAEKEQNRALTSLAESEKEANELKSRFVANVSHEIRTPMNIIIGLSEIELAKSISKQSRDVFVKISAAAKNLLTIVNDILDFSKIEANKIDIAAEEFEMEDVIEEALLVATQRLGSKNVEVISDISPLMPVAVIGDRVRLWQILKNVLDNAAKCTEKGFISLNASVLEYDDKNKTLIEFLITDTGSGMKEQQLSRIFNAFEQFDKGSVKALGTGLGMTIVKQLIELMGGTILMQSKYGAGTTVTICIPFNNVESALTFKERNCNELLARKKALVVDDLHIARKALNNFLTSINIDVTCAETKDEAIAAVKNEKFDIAIIDYGQEKHSFAFDLAEQIIKEADKRPKFLLNVPHSKSLTVAEASSTVFSAVIDKPFIPSALVEKMCYALNIACEIANNDDRGVFPGAKILLCEDNPINQEVACGMLELFGISPTIAGNGIEALNLLEDNLFDLAFVDIFMPEMNGHELTTAIRSSNKHYKDICIVAVTANVIPKEIQQCMDEGMNDHLAKPLDVDKLYDILTKYLHKHLRHKKTEKVKETHDAAFEIDGIDLNDGIKRFAYKADKYESSLVSFAKESDALIDMLKKSADINNYKQMREIVHKIKGISGNLGATALFSTTSALEELFAKNSTDEALMKALEDNVYKISESIINTFGSHLTEESLNRPYGNKDEAVKLLSNLEKAVSQYNPADSEFVVEKLREKQWIGISDKKLSQLFEYVENYQFNEAITVINDLLQL